LIIVIKEFAKNSAGKLKILDIGTGSGCIPVTLALEIANSVVQAIDISEAALTTARANATRLQAKVAFKKLDVIKQELPFADLDVVVSNPPYITKKEMLSMSKNVVSFEPHVALFVPDEDPLLFYRNIATKAKKILKPGGMIVVEISQHYGTEVKDLFKRAGFSDVSIVKDIPGKDRIVKGIC
jgi:release factor glutamine methyltransferase